MFAALKEAFSSFTSSIDDQVKRFQNTDFLNAVIAICVRVAAADGSIDPEEKEKTLKFIQSYPALKVFNASDVVNAWKKYSDFYDFSKHVGDDECNKVIRLLAGNDEAAKTAVYVGCAVGSADGDFDDDEKAVVRQVIGLLQLNQGDFTSVLS